MRHRPRSAQPTAGPELAPVTIDFFLNPGNRASEKLQTHLTALLERHPRRVRVQYRIVASERDHALATATLEAHAQGRFGDFLAVVLSARYPPRRDEQIIQVYEQLGLDTNTLRSAWADGRHDAQLAHNDSDRKRRTDKAPSLLINGRNVGRAASISFNKLETLYRTAYGGARTLLERGTPMESLYPTLMRVHALERAAKVARAELGAIDGLSSADIRELDPTPALQRQDVELPAHSTGPQDAPVAVHVFCNFLLPNCAMLNNALANLRAEFPTEVRLVFHHHFPSVVPIPAPPDASQSRADAKPDEAAADAPDGEPEDPRAAPAGDRAEDPEQPMAALRAALTVMHRAALCADEQGLFWEFYQRAYHRHLPRDQQGDIGERLDKIFSKLAVDDERLAACMQRPDGAQAVYARVRSARDAGVSETPTVVIGGRIYRGFLSSLELRALVEEALAPGLFERTFPSRDSRDDEFDRDRQ
ncbi:MAG: hypothetical protein Tsb0020_18560 [Haliangiales bacterium]